jgi:hypothetical protein
MILEEVVDLLDLALKESNLSYKGIKICELGDQRMKWRPEGTAKNYLLGLGVAEHISIDINGKHGALKIDLSKAIDKWKEYFDLVTNFGTLEHVENGIYEGFKNVHNFTKVGCAMIHDGPVFGGCPWHSPYHYYPEFFKKLCSINDYKLIMTEVRVVNGSRKCRTDLDRSLVCAVIIKKSNNPFCSKEDFIKLNAIDGLK